jgi:PKD repeat protein
VIVADVFNVELYKLSTTSFEDITSGILNVDIQYGTDVYEGPQQQIDTGQFTIVSRNPNLDPKVNPDVRFNSFIRFLDSRNVEEGKSNVFFGGLVTDIDVQYQRQDDPIITITGTDIFGAMQQATITPEIEEVVRSYVAGIEDDPDQNGVSLYYLVNLESWLNACPANIEVIVNETPGQIENSTPGDNYSTYAPARYIPQVGETFLDVINKYAQTNLNYFSVDYRKSVGTVEVYPFAKYNSFYWPPMQNPGEEFPNYNFSSDPADNRPYESILINNGYRRVANSIVLSNETKQLEDPFDQAGPIQSDTTTYGTFVDSESVEENVLTTRLNLDTIIPTTIAEDGDPERYARDIFQVVAFPSDEIQQITFDNARFEDIQLDRTYSFSNLNEFVRIKHQISDTETIDRFYDIAGIAHSITPDKWEMSFTFKPSQQEIAFIYQGEVPTIQMNSLTGDSNFEFTATITDYDLENIEQVIWCLNGTNSDVSEQWLYSYDGTRYKDGLQRNGFTQTWNFDDDGILQGPDFPTGGYGTGEWYVIPYIILKNGWVIAPHVKLTVGTPEVEARFLWSQDVTSNFGAVTFTDDSRNNEIDEPDSYFWEFGDGTTSAEKNPVHIYEAPLTETDYDVSLTVFAYGEDEEKVYNTHTETISLEEPVMTANFTFSQNRQTVTFTNTSTNVGFEMPDAYLWEFDDGTTSTLKNPIHTFPADDNETLTYDVTLTVKNVFENTTSVTKSVEVVALNASGTLPIRYLQLRQGNLYGLLPSERFGTGIAANICKFKSRTSGTQANLSYMKPVGNIQNTNSIFRSYNNNTLGTDIYSNITSAYAGGLEPDAVTVSSASDWSIIIDLETPTQFIKDIIAEFADNLNGSVGSTIGAYDIYTTTETGTLSNPNNVTWFKVGSFEPGYVPRSDFSQRQPIQKTMEPTRPMPMNIPYFDYTFNNLTATFTSYETADSYAWNFGDGTTSTLKNPVKTFPARGTYNVTLAVTNGGVVTRTTTEPVIVKALVNFDVRHVKFVQNLHTGTTPWDTPTLLLASTKVGPIALPVGLNRFALTDFQFEDYPLEFYPSISNSDIYDFGSIDITSPTQIGSSGPYKNRMLTEPQVLINPGVGIRAKSLDASNRTQWTAIIDLQKAHKGIEDFTINARRDYFGGEGPLNAPPANPGVSYSVYVTNDISATIDPNAVTWTKIGNDITPSNLAAPKNANFALGETFSILD